MNDYEITGTVQRIVELCKEGDYDEATLLLEDAHGDLDDAVFEAFLDHINQTKAGFDPDEDRPDLSLTDVFDIIANGEAYNHDHVIEDAPTAGMTPIEIARFESETFRTE